MNTDVDIDKLASLARIKVDETEKADLKVKFESILAYVDQIKNAPVSDIRPTYDTRNVIREDTNPNTPGKTTEDLLSSAPEREGNYFKVKKIL